MARYLIQASYSQLGIEGLIKAGGTSRRTAIEAATKGLGGTLESFYFGFGDSDVYGIVDWPDHVSAASFALAVGAPGTVTQIKTTVLLTAEEVDQAAKKASAVAYRPPGH